MLVRDIPGGGDVFHIARNADARRRGAIVACETEPDVVGLGETASGSLGVDRIERAVVPIPEIVAVVRVRIGRAVITDR